MIVLCRNHHGMKGEGPRTLDRKALRQIKANLAIINGRYSDLERRLIAEFARNPEPRVKFLPGTMELLVRYLVDDGYLKIEEWKSGNVRRVYGADEHEGQIVELPEWVALSLADAGSEFIETWKAARPLETHEL